MLFRVFAAAIAAFWVVMMTLLVQLEYRPAKTELLAVPVAHVFKLMFTHRQPSYLTIRDKKGGIGRFNLQADEKLERQLNFDGNARANFAENQRTQLHWNGLARFDEALAVQRFELHFESRRPFASVFLRLDLSANTLSYDFQSADGFSTTQTVALEAAGLREALDELGIDEHLLATVNAARPQTLEVSARLSSVNVRNEKVDDKVSAWLVTVRGGEVVLAEIYVSQLGQVLLARTPFGYELRSEDISL